MENKACGFTVLFLLCLMQVVTMHANRATAAVSCGKAVSALASCGDYLVGTGSATPTPACCRAVKSLNDMAKTGVERKLLCQCFKESAPSFGVLPEKARKLPILCKLNIKVGLGMDCNKV